MLRRDHEASVAWLKMCRGGQDPGALMRMLGALEVSSVWNFPVAHVSGVLNSLADGISRWNPTDDMLAILRAGRVSGLMAGNGTRAPGAEVSAPMCWVPVHTQRRVDVVCNPGDFLDDMCETLCPVLQLLEYVLEHVLYAMLVLVEHINPLFFKHTLCSEFSVIVCSEWS